VVPGLLFLASAAVQGAVIFPHVTNVNNSGSGSLRAAITAANANGKDGAIVFFNIGSSCGPHVIHLATALPDLTAEVHIEGYTQSGSSKNTLDFDAGNDASICIVLDGDGQVDDAFTVPASVPDVMEISVQGIAFSGFTHSAVNLRGGSNHVVAGIRTGGTLGSAHLNTNFYGVILAAGVHDSTIGGLDNGDVNQFGDITHNAVYIASSSGSRGAASTNEVLNDDVGFVFNSHKRVVLPTGGAGIAVSGMHNTLWRVDLENAGASGLHFSNPDATGNRAYASVFANNAGDGILFDDDAHYNGVDQNDIHGNGGAGVRVINGQGNDIQFNEMAGNTGLGIDLAGAGVTPNDNDSLPQPPDYANRGLNSPVLTFAGGGNTSGGVSGSVTTVPGRYYIDVYASSACDASGPKDSVWLSIGDSEADVQTIGAPTVQGQGTASFTLPITFSTMPKFVTATATDGAGNTSEFSSCVPYVR
jgi:hypothetical protein